MNWFRLYVELTRDHKIRRESTATRWTWVAVLTLCRRSPKPPALLLSHGLPVQLGDVADEANVTTRLAREAMDIFMQRRMVRLTTVDGIPDVWVVTNWNKRQPNSDDVNARVAAHRERVRNVTDNVSGNEDFQLPETAPEGEEETETDTDPKGSGLALVRSVPKPSQTADTLGQHRAVYGVLVEHFGEPQHRNERTLWGKAAKLMVEAGVDGGEAGRLIRFAKAEWGIDPTAISVANNVTNLRRAVASGPRKRGKEGPVDQARRINARRGAGGAA